MRKIKVLDKNEVHKGDITELDGGINFSVTENGYGSLGFQYVGEQDIEQADIVQVIDEDLATVETITSNNDYLSLDGVNDKIESGSQETKVFRYPNTVGEITTSSAGDSYQYWQGFSETDTPNVVSYIDVGGLFEEIAIDKAFSMKFAFRTGPGSVSGYIFMHNTFSIYMSGNTVSVGFIGGDTKSFTTTGNNYYRCVLTYDGTNFVLYYNSTLALGTATPSYNLTEIYSTIGNYIQNMRFYNMFIRDRVLTAGEITSENASHTIVTTSDTILNYTPSISTPPAVHTTRDGDLGFDGTESIVFDGRFKLGSNGSNALDSQPIVTLPYARLYSHLDTNRVRLRYDLGGSTYDGTVSGGVTIDDGAIVFDRTSSSYVNTIPYTTFNSYNGGVIIERTSTLTGGNVGVIVSIRVNSNNNIEIFRNNSGQTNLKYKAGGVENSFNLNITDSPKQLGITRDTTADEVKFYLDGIQTGATLTGLGVRTGNPIIWLGYNGEGINYFNGSIRYCKIYEYTPTPSDILTIHNGGTITDGLVLSYSGLDYAGTLASPTTIYDMSQSRITEHVLGTDDTDWHYYRCIIEKIGTKWYSRFLLDDTETVLECDDTPNVEYTTKAIIGEYDGGYFDGDVKGYYLAALNEAYKTTDDPLLESGNTLAFTDHEDVLVRDMNEGEGTILGTTGLIDGATRATDNTAPFVKTYKRNVEYPIYYGQVTSIKPVLQEGRGKRTQVSCIGIQTTLNDKFYRLPDGTLQGDQILNPDQIIQNVLDQQEYHYLDYTGIQLIESQDYTRYNKWLRGNMTLATTTTTAPNGDTVYLTRKLNGGVTQAISLEYYDIGLNSNAPYIYRFRVRAVSGTITLNIDYNNDGTYFTQKTLTIGRDWQRIGVIASRSGGSGGIKFRIRSSDGIYISEFDLFAQNSSTLPELGTYPLDISWNNVKGIQAFQNAIQYSGASIKRLPSKHIEFFDPDTTGTPDHYIIEEAHLSYIEKSVNSDEVFNSVAMSYIEGVTQFIDDDDSIDSYRRREVIVNADNINSQETAEDYAQLYLDQVKDTKDYVKMTVTRAYPIGSLRVGDLVQINGNTLGVRKGYITRIDMNDNTAIVYLDHYNGLGKSLSFLR